VYFNKTQYFLADENKTRQFAVIFAQWLQSQQACEQGWIIYLEGDLGAGKSFLTRSLIQSYLPEQKVKSPTYTLVESYELPQCVLHHFDLYRLCDPEELEFLAIRDLLTPPFMAFVEWPSQAEGVLPVADVVLALQTDINNGETARTLTLEIRSGRATQGVEKLTKKIGTQFVI
jgi:tRNA threonylcarbamoyladenosine biosynthesis protein TsaE